MYQKEYLIKILIFRCVSEFATNLAGAEVMVPLVVLLILSTSMAVFFGYKLWSKRNLAKNANMEENETKTQFLWRKKDWSLNLCWLLKISWFYFYAKIKLTIKKGLRKTDLLFSIFKIRHELISQILSETKALDFSF